jgi:DNA-binding NtrC family response regulator
MNSVNGRILIVDDEANIRTALAKLLSKLGHSTKAAASSQEALQMLRGGRIQIVISDLRMPGEDGLNLLAKIKEIDPMIDVIMMTAYGTIETAVEAMRRGAYDYIEKPINQERLPILLARVLEKQALTEDNRRLRRVVSAKEEYGNLVGKSDKIAKLYELIEMLAPTPATVLIQGESGVGKELIAHAIHQRSPRAGGPLISLNCGAIPETLLESELFGFEKGASRHSFPGRSGRDEPQDTDRAATRSGVEGVAAIGRSQARFGGRPRGRRNEQNIVRGGCCRTVSRGSLLQAQRGSCQGPTPARAVGRHSLTGRTFPARICRQL